MPVPPDSQLWGRIPLGLRERRHWAIAGPDKAPRQIDGSYAKVNDPSTWTDYPTARQAAYERGWHIGYILSPDDPFTCVDFDVKGDVMPEDFAPHIEMLDSYTERSASGLGFHVWVVGRVEQAAKSPTIEIYSQDRFMICTGNVFRNKPIENRDALVKDLAGEWHNRRPSHSELDLALTTKLWQAFLLTPAGQREKAKRLDYARRTMGLATNDNQFGEGTAEEGQLMWEGMKPGLMARYYLPLLDDEELLRQPTTRWLVKGILPDAGIGTFFGQSGTFKSFLVLDMMAHISSGKEEWFRRKVKAAPCVYVPFEGRGGIPKRVQAWRRAHGPTNMRFIMEPINLRKAEDRNWLVQSVIARGWAGGVLCIDTLAQAGGSFEENSSKDMGAMIEIIQELQQKLGGVVLVVHHSGKVAERGLRGHSSLGAAVDFAIECRIDEQGPLFRLDKQKDGEDGLEFPFMAELVVLDLDGEGEPITSRAIVEQKRVPATDADAEAVLTAIRELGRTSQRKTIEKLKHLPERRVAAAIVQLMEDGKIKSNGKRGRFAEIWAA